jgi:hypothetical protein
MKNDLMAAHFVLENLVSQFGLRFEEVKAEPIISSRLIGFEIKVPTLAHFPDIWEMHVLDNGKKRYADLSDAEKVAFSQDLSRAEGEILKTFQRTREAGLEAGPWKTWEFILPPTTQLHDVVGIIRALQHPKVELIKEVHGDPQQGRVIYPLHMTVGGLKRNRDSYMLLSMLELLFCTKERIEGWTAWDAKGKSGLHERGEQELSFDEVAVELRTLQLPPPERLTFFLKTVCYWLTVMERNGETWKELTTQIDRLMKNHGLQNALWLSPSRENDQNWKRFAGHFSVMSSEWKQFLRKNRVFLSN